MTSCRSPLLSAALSVLICASLCAIPGCAALVGAAFRELGDDGDHPRYEKKGFGSHFIDELFEDDNEEDC